MSSVFTGVASKPESIIESSERSLVRSTSCIDEDSKRDDGVDEAEDGVYEVDDGVDEVDETEAHPEDTVDDVSDWELSDVPQGNFLSLLCFWQFSYNETLANADSMFVPANDALLEGIGFIRSLGIDGKQCMAGETGSEEDGDNPESTDTVVTLEFERSTR